MTLSCDTCALCCKLVAIEEVDSPAGVWCKHCKPGAKACQIYEDRPERCRSYECLWLQGQTRYPQLFTPALRPDRSRVVITPQANSKLFAMHVDPGRRDAWRQQPFVGLLHKLLTADPNHRAVIIMNGIVEFVVWMDGGVLKVVTKDKLKVTEKGNILHVEGAT